MPDSGQYRKPTSDLGYIGPGIDARGRTFWLGVTDADGYQWHVRGRFEVSRGVIEVTEIHVEPVDPDQQGTKALDEPELIRRLTRIQPIRARVRRQLLEDTERIADAVKEAANRGRPAGVLDEWAEDYTRMERELRPWRSRYHDSDWAEWALDYLGRVREAQSTYGVLRDVADERAWGRAKYETVRARLRTIRDFGWIVGEGHLVEEGPRLREWLRDRKESQNG